MLSVESLGLCIFVATCISSPCRHSLVPVVPESLLEMVQLPSIYIMGLHSSLRNDVRGNGENRHSVTYSGTPLIGTPRNCDCS